MRYRCGDYVLDTLRYESQRTGESHPLRPKVFQVLASLLAHRDRVVSKQELLDQVGVVPLLCGGSSALCLAPSVGMAR
jgi:DNA-binding response OmpR family regulator